MISKKWSNREARNNRGQASGKISALQICIPAGMSTQITVFFFVMCCNYTVM